MNLNDFSYEVLFNILLNAEPKDIANYCQTSHRASGICKSPDFWRMKLWKDYGEQKQVEGMTWQKQYQLGPIRVINSPIASGWNYYGIIDDQGDLYMSGYNERGVLGIGSKNRIRTNIRKVNLKSKVISVTAGLYTDRDSYTVGVVTEDGEAYFWGTYDKISTPKKLDFPRPGKIVKFVFENASFNKGIIMDNGLAYLLNSSEEIFLIPADKGTKIVDLVIPLGGFYRTKVASFFLDNYGNVFLFRVTRENKNIMIKLDLPDPIKQLSISSNEGYVALSIKGEVYTWGYKLRGAIRKSRYDYIFKFSGGEMAISGTFLIFKADIPAFVVSISSGNDNIAAVTSKGNVYVWGFNYGNRLVSNEDEVKLLSSGKMNEKMALASDHKYPFIKLPLELELESKIKSISLGGVFTIALTEDGVINYWGAPDMAPKNTI